MFRCRSGCYTGDTKNAGNTGDTVSQFSSRYGSWAVVAGASEGLGAAFARQLAARRMNLLLIARQADMLSRVSEDIRHRHDVEVRCLVQDLAGTGLAQVLQEATAGLEVGVVIYNAAYVPTGRFLDTDPEDLEKLVRVNVQGPVTMIRALAPAMCERNKGAVVLVSSLAGMQGVPRIAGYAASKAFNSILAEALWAELGKHNVDVIAVSAGAMPTPGFERNFKKGAPGMLDPVAVAERTLKALGRGPHFIPGLINRIFATISTRLLSRRAAICLMGTSTRHLDRGPV